MLNGLNVQLKVTKKKGKKPTKEPYFNKAVETAIIAYNNEPDPVKRSTIYRQSIHYALDKLAENLIHNNKFYYFVTDNIHAAKHEVIAFLITKLEKYVESKGKAFSYFDRIALNYLIINNKMAYEKLKNHKSELLIDSDATTTIAHDSDESQKDLFIFFGEYIRYMQKNIDILFKKQMERQIAYAVLQLFETRDAIEIFNKKEFYFDIKEKTRSTTLQVTKVVNIMRQKFQVLYQQFITNGFVSSSTV